MATQEQNNIDTLVKISETDIIFQIDEFRIIEQSGNIDIESEIKMMKYCGYYTNYPELSLNDIYKRWIHIYDAKLKIVSSVLEYHRSMKLLYKFNESHSDSYQKIDKYYQKMISARQKLTELFNS